MALGTDGAVRAMVGGKSYLDSQFNRAAQAMRQPGSAFKPFVYLTALQQGARPDDTFYDEPITIGDWSPENYNGGYRGKMTMIEALKDSTNTVAVRVSPASWLRKYCRNCTYHGHYFAEMEANRSLTFGNVRGHLD